ncbi:MAG: SGNH/GDSL hydrolase family protein [Candidatus Brocadiia bacterium]
MAPPSLKKAVLVGDSIRMAYQPLVASELEGQINILGPEENGGDSRRVLNNIREWVVKKDPDVAHVNCGLHDLRIVDNDYQVPLEEYVHNVHGIIDILTEDFAGIFIWATTTPVIDQRHQRVKSFERHQQDVIRYNQAALKVVESHGVRVNDLYNVVQASGRSPLLSEDGVHMNDRGNTILAEAVSQAVLRAAED